MNLVEISNTGKFNYHLKILADLIEKDENGKYNLSDKGRLAAQFLQKFDGKEAEPTSLQWGDATLIGFAGCIVAGINPIYWATFLIASFGFIVPVPLLVIIIVLEFGFALIAPGVTMRFLAIRRAHSHDPYDLFKPAFVGFILLVMLGVVLIILGGGPYVKITSTVVFGDEPAAFSMRLSTLLFLGSLFSLVIVALPELVGGIGRKVHF